MSIGDKEKRYNMAGMIWKPDKFLAEMSLLAHFRKNDMIFMGPVDAPMALEGQEKIVVKSDTFGDFEANVKYL
jgi:2-keto-4-pentenoate hydratase/2-oxohepta-3-ene-1,7-dioic acid hydratase in catechol pathway